MKGVLIASPGTGSGKTTISAALMAALTKRGLRVQPFKCGPDFIDPGHHALMCGRPSHNLDTWMLSAEANKRIFASACREADFAVVEGMMGLFDGVSGGSEQGSSAEIAKLLGFPVLLVVDASAAARSVAALVHGFKSFDPRTRVIGVMLNRAGGAAHAKMLIDALRAADPNLIVGWFPHESKLHLPERYLGLQTAAERSWTHDSLATMADLLTQHFPLDQLIEACSISLPNVVEPTQVPIHVAQVKIGLARDRAFCFYYQAAVDELRRHGAEIVEFSPLDDERLPAELDGIYLGGGYPELYAETLSQKTALIDDLRHLSAQGKPIYGECGGLIFLARDLVTKDGAKWPMAGLLPLSIEMTDELVHFGYAEVEFTADGLAVKGTRLRGHSFHCSRVISEGTLQKTAIVSYTLSRQSEPEGYAAGAVFGSYVHLHFAADSRMAARFVARARSARTRSSVAS